MATELVPYTEFRSEELAPQLQEAVISGQSLLVARNILGPIHRYGGELAVGIQNVEKGQHEHEQQTLGHYAIIGDSGDVIGAASLYPDLPLRAIRAPIPPILAVGALTVRYPEATPNIHAWTIEGGDELSGAYSRLRSIAFAIHYQRQTSQIVTTNNTENLIPWTIEPTSSPQHVHNILLRAGLLKNSTQRFDDGESRRRTPPHSTLYTASLQPIALPSHPRHGSAWRPGESEHGILGGVIAWRR